MESEIYKDLAASIWRAGIPNKDLPARVNEALREQIKSKRLPPGTKFPHESVLARELGVSRPTLREAIRSLSQDGIIEIKHGVGTFVADRADPILDMLEATHSLSALIRSAGRTPSCRDVAITIDPIPANVAADMGVEARRKVAHVSRTHLVDGIPLAVTHEYLTLSSAEDDFELVKNFDGNSFFSYMQEHSGFRVYHSRVFISAIGADTTVAQRLGLKKGSPILLMRQIHYDAANKPTLYTMSYQNSQIVEFTMLRMVRPT